MCIPIGVFKCIRPFPSGCGRVRVESLEHATLETDVYLQRVICSFLHTRHVNLNGLRA